MWQRFTNWIKHLWPGPRGNQFGDSRRSKLMGLYLDQANQTGRPRHSTEHYQERRDGKYAQRRERD